MAQSEQTLLASITKLIEKLTSMENKIDKFVGDLEAVRTKVDLVMSSISLVQQEQVQFAKLLQSCAADSMTSCVGNQIGALMFDTEPNDLDNAPMFDTEPVLDRVTITGIEFATESDTDLTVFDLFTARIGAGFDDGPLFNEEPEELVTITDCILGSNVDAPLTCSTKFPTTVVDPALPLVSGSLLEFTRIEDTRVLDPICWGFNTYRSSIDGRGALFPDDFGLLLHVQGIFTSSIVGNWLGSSAGSKSTWFGVAFESGAVFHWDPGSLNGPTPMKFTSGLECFFWTCEDEQISVQPKPPWFICAAADRRWLEQVELIAGRPWQRKCGGPYWLSLLEMHQLVVPAAMLRPWDPKNFECSLVILSGCVQQINSCHRRHNPLAKEDLKAFGCGCDWKRAFIIADINPFYDAFVWWQMRKLNNMGRVKALEGSKVYMAAAILRPETMYEQSLVESLSDLTLYMAYYTITYLLQHGNMYGNERASLRLEQMTDDVWDYVLCHGPSPKSDITLALLSQMKQEFEYWYPFDIRVSDTTRFVLADDGDGLEGCFGKGAVGLHELHWFAVSTCYMAVMVSKKKHDYFAVFLKLAAELLDSSNGEDDANCVMVWKSLIMSVSSMLYAQELNKSPLLDYDLDKGVEMLSRAVKLLSLTGLSALVISDQLVENIGPFLHTFNFYHILYRMGASTHTQQLQLVKNFVASKSCTPDHLLSLGKMVSEHTQPNLQVAEFVRNASTTAALTSHSPNYGVISAALRKLAYLAASQDINSTSDAAYNIFRQDYQLVVGLRDGSVTEETGEEGSDEEEDFKSGDISLLEKPPWSNDIAQRLGDKPPFEEGVMS